MWQLHKYQHECPNIVLNEHTTQICRFKHKLLTARLGSSSDSFQVVLFLRNIFPFLLFLVSNLVSYYPSYVFNQNKSYCP